MNYHSAAALLIFGLVYGIILAGSKSPRKLDRPAAALIGAVLMVLTGVLTKHEAQAAISLSTLSLLFGMMIVIHYATIAGLLDMAAQAFLLRCHTAWQLLAAVCLASGLLSALFVNDTICLLMTPLLLTITHRAKLRPEPYLIALATSSNVGSVMTLTGNPQNMLIGQSSHWTWAQYAMRMVPIGMLCMLLNGLIVALIYRKHIPSGRLPNNNEKPGHSHVHRKLAVRTLITLAGLLAAFAVGMPMDLAALSAAVVILVLANRNPEHAFAAVDWALLLFFAGLFVVVAGVTRTESHWIAAFIPAITRNTGSIDQLTRFSAATIAGGNLFSNVPFVMLLRNWIVDMPHAPLLWLALASAATFSGNLTLLGSVANLIVAEKAKDSCNLSFLEFLKVGVPTTAITTLAAIGVLSTYVQLGFVK